LGLFGFVNRYQIGITQMKVTVNIFRSKLRLRWTFEGKRECLTLGIVDSLPNRVYAEQKARQIELDWLSGNYDRTLLKYKPRAMGKTATEISTIELFERYTQAMKQDKSLSPNALQKYRALANHLKAFFKDAGAQGVGDRRAGDFTSYLMELMTGQTAKSYLFLLRGCWEWAKGKYHIAPENPWAESPYKVKSSPTKRVRPFSEREVKAILVGFKEHQHFKHYYPFVMFLFHTGARPGEAIGLRWGNVADDFTHAVVCETVSRGHRRDRTKTGKSRVVNLGSNLSQLLKERCEAIQPKPNDLVFPAPRGGAIDDHNFLNRAWKKVLASVGVEYRKTYAVRHSVISHALANGVNPIALAEQTGHDKRVLLSTYAHVIQSQSVFVEF
jgi:integrase